MRRNMSKVISVVLTMSLALSMCACSAKSSADTENTTAEAETEIETEEETEEETVDASGNDVSNNGVSENDAEDITEEETLTESEEEEEIEEESTNSKTSEKDSTKSETTTSETTTEAVTVQELSAVVNGTHYVGETLTGADIEVTVTMSDGETLTNPAGWSAQPLTLNSTSNLITVAYEGASVTITVEAQNVPETTTAATVASNTTSTTTTTKAETTQAATTQATTAATTAAPTTAAETTTAATTEATAAEYETVGYVCEDGEFSYEFALALFDAQNALREEIGLDDFIWDDEMYEVAKTCAKICGDAGMIDHSLISEYTSGDEAKRVLDDGTILWINYPNNLQLGGVPTATDSTLTRSDLYIQATAWLSSIKSSEGHYKWIKVEGLKYTAIAAYRKGTTMYVSYLFYSGDDAWME